MRRTAQKKAVPQTDSADRDSLTEMSEEVDRIQHLEELEMEERLHRHRQQMLRLLQRATGSPTKVSS